MKSNVIVSASRQVQIQSEGTLAIIGQSCSRVVFMVYGITTIGLTVEDLECFASNCVIVQHRLGGMGEIILFEYSLRGELRNPQKLLKSVRNKLMRVIRDADTRTTLACCELEHEVSMSVHRPGRINLFSTDNSQRDADEARCEQYDEEDFLTESEPVNRDCLGCGRRKESCICSFV